MVRDAKHLEVAAFHAHDADCWHAPFSSMSEHASVDPVAVDPVACAAAAAPSSSASASAPRAVAPAVAGDEQ